MQLELAGETYTLSPENEALALSFLAQNMLSGLAVFRKNHPALSLAMKAMAREMLSAWEKEARKAGHSEEVCKQFRPPKKMDPVAYLQVISLQIMQGRLRDVTLVIGSRDHELTTCQLILPDQNQGGRSLDSDGNLGERQDDRFEISGRSLLPAVPDGAALRAG